jgi:hypothetical protein
LLISRGYHLDGVDDGYLKLNLGRDALDQDLELIDFFTDDMNLEIFANGKLARIRNYSGAEPIIFWEEATGTTHMHTFMFMLLGGNQWVLVN